MVEKCFQFVLEVVAIELVGMAMPVGRLHRGVLLVPLDLQFWVVRYRSLVRGGMFHVVGLEQLSDAVTAVEFLQARGVESDGVPVAHDLLVIPIPFAPPSTNRGEAGEPFEQPVLAHDP